MQYQVPQFIEVEDKLFGPLTLKQFIYLAGGVGIAVVLYIFIPIKFIAIIIAVPFVAFAIALSFYKINSKPFIFTLEAAVGYWLKNKLYIWKKTTKKIEAKKEMVDEGPSIETLLAPRLSDSRLKDLAWSLDVKERLDSSPLAKYKEKKLSFEEEEKERVEFTKNYDLGAKGHSS
ncbi:MAG: PrgI family protein [Patescibacteria group bacterium]